MKTMQYPVPISDEAKLIKFNNAVNKAKLIYENIQIHKEYQCAFLWNGKKEDKRHAALMYMGEDGHVYTTKESEWSIDQFVWNSKSYYKGATIDIYDIGDKQAKKHGLLSHTGKVIVPPNYEQIGLIDDTFLLAVDTVVKETNYLRICVGVIYDYAGNDLAHGIGVWCREKFLMDRKKRTSIELIWCSDDGYRLNDNMDRVEKYDGPRNCQVYIVKENTLYKSINIQYKEGQALWIYNNQFGIYSIDRKNKRAIRAWRPRDLLSQSVKIAEAV